MMEGLFSAEDGFGHVARSVAHVVNIEGVKKLDETTLALGCRSQRLWEKAIRKAGETVPVERQRSLAPRLGAAPPSDCPA